METKRRPNAPFEYRVIGYLLKRDQPVERRVTDCKTKNEAVLSAHFFVEQYGESAYALIHDRFGFIVEEIRKP